MSESRARKRLRSLLVIVQVALALVLLVSSGLMVRTFRALTRVNLGFVGSFGSADVPRRHPQYDGEKPNGCDPPSGGDRA